MVPKEQLEILVHWGCREEKETLVFQGSQGQEVIQAKREYLDYLARWVLQVQLEREDHQEVLVQEVSKAYQEFQEKMVCPAKMAILEYKVFPV